MNFCPFNPVRFKAGIRPVGGRTFANKDRIFLEVFHTGGQTPDSLVLHDAVTDAEVFSMTWHTFYLNDEQSVSFYELPELDSGEYYLSFGSYISQRITVTDISELSGTIYVEYSQAWNRDRDDIISLINGNVRYFGLRLYGGFKDNAWSFGVDNEQYISANGDIVELSAIDYTDKTLTIGLSEGLSIEEGEFLNRIFTCRYIFIDGRRYAPTGDVSLNKTETYEGSGRFNYTIILREAHYIHPRIERLLRLYLRKAGKYLRSNPKGYRRYR